MKINLEIESETLTRVTKKVDEFRGTGLTNRHESMSLLITPPRPQPPTQKKSASLSTGDFPGQVYIMGTNNSAGWDFEFAADLP